MKSENDRQTFTFTQDGIKTFSRIKGKQVCESLLTDDVRFLQ